MGRDRGSSVVEMWSAYLLPTLLVLGVVLAAFVTIFVVSRCSATPEGKKTPFATDDRTALGATDEGSEVPPSRERVA